MRQTFAVLAIFGFLLAPVGRADVEHLSTLPDFKVELVLKAEKDKHGSWISLGKDGKGRLLLGGQRNQPLTRLTLDADGKVAKEEVLKLPVTEVMGVLWAFDSLYLNAHDGKKFGLFRLKDKEDDGVFESVEMLREWQGGAGEHGAHGIVLGKDGFLYVVAGNFVNVPLDVQPTSPHRNYADDTVLPRTEDGNGFGAGRKPPGGYIVRLDKDGKGAELFAAGQRNCYDIDISPDGEIFGFDSDMEWDWGTPWYRPTRVFHATSGADHGFREGTAKWPEHYPDSLPATVNIGIGSPTGVAFGTGARFPAKYQRALYILDWTYGRVIAVHLTPDGAGYSGTFENFVAPRGLVEKSGKKSPNNVTDIVVGADGALYFTTGGRNTQGNLYRVTYTGMESIESPAAGTDAGAQSRGLRRLIEQAHREPKRVVLEDEPGSIWSFLGHRDRYLRYAARIAVERNPLGAWKEKALAETHPQSSLTALLALARYAGRGDQPAIFSAITRLSPAQLTDQQKLERIRIMQVSIARQGKPAPDVAAPIVAELSAMYPAAGYDMNRELAQTLIALDVPDAVARTVKLLGEAKTQEEQVAYALALKSAQSGWTPELRKQYLSWWTIDRKVLGHPPELLRWFEEAGRGYGDGSSFANFLKKMHAEVVAGLPADQRSTLAEVIDAYTPPGAKNAPKPRERKLVKQYTMKDLEPAIASSLTKRNYNRGKEAFAAAQCIACHKFGSEGGASGPDITAVSSRFKTRDLLESIVEPSKVISEQYQNMDVRLKDGDVVWGRIIEDTPEKVVVVPDPLKPDEKVTVKRSDIKSVGPSKLSPMPDGLINVLTKDEILDMLAYIESAGNRQHPAFK